MKLAFLRPCLRLVRLGDFALLFGLSLELGRDGSCESLFSSAIAGSESRLSSGDENLSGSLLRLSGSSCTS